MKVIVTGGAGFIGSHTVVELVNAGMSPVIVDNFSNSRREVLERLRGICGRDIPFFEADVNDRTKLERVFEQERPEAVIHFAGFKAVAKSVSDPLAYWRNNVSGLLTLLEVMQRFGVTQLVFSSSATVYTGHPIAGAITENFPLAAMNPYGQTKLACEQMVQDLASSDPAWKMSILRYFNPVGAHESGLIGEDPEGQPDNLTPYVTQVLVGKLPYLPVFGGDYDTPDGTGIRDYIHVVDLARAHVKALEHLTAQSVPQTLNLGTGVGHSVKEVIASYEKAAGKPVPYKIRPRRAGDVGAYFADPSLAEKTLGWKAEKDLDDMCRDSWRWQSKNPNGYRTAAAR